MFPTLANMIVFTWLKLVQPDHPNLVKHWYCTDLRSRSLASIKPEISQALKSFLEELHTAADSKVLRATTAKHKRRNPRTQCKNFTKPTITSRGPRSCPLSKQVGRNDQHQYKSKVHIQHRRRRNWHNGIDPSSRRWGWPTNTPTRPDYFAPCQHQAVTTLQGLLETMPIDDHAGHRCWNQHD